LTARDLFVGADGRPRWGWRLVLFGLAVVASNLIVGSLLAALFGLAWLTSGARLVYYEWLSVLTLLGAHALMLAAVEKRGWDFVAMGREALRAEAIVRGLLLGGLAIGVPSALLLAAHLLRVQPAAPGSWMGAAGSITLLLAPAALWEELAFRGYPFAVLRERFGAAVALGVTSVLFGLLHVMNPGAAPLPILAVMLAGVFLGGVLLVTRSLYAAWAAHLAWNWVMAAIFHMAVSGGGVPAPDYRVVEVGPDWITGGTWGPEGGVGALLGMSAGLLYLFARPLGRARGTPDTGNTFARRSGREESDG
jgi:membrane protease YdiL (CAAX protease family)